MALTYFPFASGAGSALSESQWGQMIRSLQTNGVVRALSNDTGKGTLGGELKVFADSTGMQIKVPIGEGWLQGYYYAEGAQETLALAAAHATLARKDRVVVRINLALKTIVVAVLTGIPGASPIAPALTQGSTIWEDQLASINVAAAVTTIAAGDVIDERAYSRNPSGINAWAYLSYPGGIPTANGSVNVDSLTDHGTGDMSMTFRRGFATANYMVMATASGAGYAAQDGAAPATGGVRIIFYNTGHTAFDPGRAYVGVSGDS